jgi:hypothetical protein
MASNSQMMQWRSENAKAQRTGEVHLQIQNGRLSAALWGSCNCCSVMLTAIISTLLAGVFFAFFLKGISNPIVNVGLDPRPNAGTATYKWIARLQEHCDSAYVTEIRHSISRESNETRAPGTNVSLKHLQSVISDDQSAVVCYLLM